MNLIYEVQFDTMILSTVYMNNFSYEKFNKQIEEIIKFALKLDEINKQHLLVKMLSLVIVMKYLKGRLSSG